MTKTKKWSNLGLVYKGKSGLDPYLSVNKNLSITIDGNKVDTKYVNLPRYLTVYDKDSRRELIIGKLVKREKDGQLNQYVDFVDGVEFSDNGDLVLSSGFGSLKDSQTRLAELDAAEQDGKLAGDKLEQAREIAENSVYQVTITPPRD